MRAIVYVAVICFVALALVVSPPSPAAAQAQSFSPRDDSPENYPAGEGRDQSYSSCTPCHGFSIVAQQGQSRRQWEETLDWMTQRHGMPKLEGNDRIIVLDYLEAAFPPRASPRGWQNPFQTR